MFLRLDKYLCWFILVLYLSFGDLDVIFLSEIIPLADVSEIPGSGEDEKNSVQVDSQDFSSRQSCF